MTTTISVTTKRQVVLPKAFCQRKRIRPGTALRVTEVAGGLYVTPIVEPTERELKEVIASAGSLRRRQTPAEEDLVQDLIAKHRAARRLRRR
jgi:bifunctional DNA-binding transcriptional regulator/antitoxin component of YhaV-PrlF toxin-antitoxin module